MNHPRPQKHYVQPTLLWVSKRNAGDIILRELLFGDLRAKEKGPREGPLLTSDVAQAQVVFGAAPLLVLGAAAATAPSN